MAPSPGIFLTAVAQRTRRIHIGPLVYLLPLYNPLRLVNEIAMLDQLSGGRFEIGVGRGVSPYELAYYRIPFYESREMFEDALAAVAGGLRNDHLTYHGRYYKYDSVPIELHTKQRPNPPFWYGVSTEDSFRFAGRHNMHMVGNGPNTMLAKLIPLYREAREQHLGSVDSLKLNSHVATPTVGAIRHFFVADTDREADEIARPAYKAYYNNIQKLWLDHRVIVPHFVDDVDRDRRLAQPRARRHRVLLRAKRMQLPGALLRMGQPDLGAIPPLIRLVRNQGDARIYQGDPGRRRRLTPPGAFSVGMIPLPDLGEGGTSNASAR
jgi:alkanesulfonate monooxygenase SsuD/methylene tetrahydromethanopterin reductase-like flavin-dependent oxidoreductase (luciferase family)